MPPRTQKILVVEDDERLGSLLEKALSTEGFEVTWTREGGEALSIAFANHPDVTLLDILLPMMDGIGVLEKLREDEWGKTAKVIVLTNLSPHNNISQEVADSAPAHYIVKANTSLEDIVAKIKEVLAQ